MRLLEAYGLLLLTVAVAVFFSVLPKTGSTFPTLANLQIVVAGQSALAVVAIGALVPLVANEWDLSVGATAGLAGIFAASYMSAGGSLVVGILIALAVAFAVGLANGLLITRFGVNAVITTLGTSVVIAGVVNQKTGGLAVVSNLPRPLVKLGQSTFLEIPDLVYVAVAVGLLAYYLLDHTPMGRYLYAYGSNPEAARLVGVRTKLLLFWSFVIAALLGGVAGLMQISYAGGAAPGVGPSFTLPGLAAAFLSAAAVKPGKYNVWGTFVALLFLAVLNSGLNLAGAPPYINSYVNGIALITGVGFSAYLGRLRSRSLA